MRVNIYLTDSARLIATAYAAGKGIPVSRAINEIIENSISDGAVIDASEDGLPRISAKKSTAKQAGEQKVS